MLNFQLLQNSIYFKKLILQVYYFAYCFQVKWIEKIILIKCNKKLHQISQDRCFSKNKTRKYSRNSGHFPNHVPVIYKVTLSSSVDIMECLAVVRALQFASECGFGSIILEGDFETVHKALSCEDVSLSSIGYLVDDVKIHAVIFFHIRRKGNFVTHSKLAKHVRYVSDLSVLIEDISSHQLSVVAAPRFFLGGSIRR